MRGVLFLFPEPVDDELLEEERCGRERMGGAPCKADLPFEYREGYGEKDEAGSLDAGDARQEAHTQMGEDESTIKRTVLLKEQFFLGYMVRSPKTGCLTGRRLRCSIRESASSRLISRRPSCVS